MPEARPKLDALLDRARRVEPPSLSAVSAERLVQRAIDESQLVRVPRRSRRMSFAWASVLTLAAAALLLAVLQRAEERLVVEHGARPLRLSLRTGDTLLVSGGSSLEITEQAKARRSVTLSSGTALFDVAKLAAGEQFEVRTPDAVIRVVGTVFSVRVVGGRTEVFVHEGKVDVGGARIVASKAWVSSGRLPAGPVPFAEDARAAVQARRAPSLRSARTFARAPSVEAAVTYKTGQPASAAQAEGPGHADEPARRRAPVIEDAAAASLVAPPTGIAASRLGRARALLRTGDAEGALRLLSEAASRGPAERLLVADALQALDRFRQAVAAYEALAADSADPLRAQAAYRAAELSLHALNRPAACLSVLNAHGLDAERAPLRERASVLRIDALTALGRTAEAEQAAREYLRREPETETSLRLRKRFVTED